MALSKGILSKISKFKKKSFVAVVEAGNAGQTASKYSGTPYLQTGENWPICPNCKKPMQLFLQLNLDDIKEQTGQDFGSGLLQLFFCTSDTEPMCDTVCNGNVPEGTCKLLRIVKPKGDQRIVIVPKLEPSQIKPMKITGWKEFEEYPLGTEIQEPYANTVLNVIKAKYDLRDKSQALNKFIELYGPEEVEPKIKDSFVKKILKQEEDYFKRHKGGFSTQTVEELRKEIEGK